VLFKNHNWIQYVDRMQTTKTLQTTGTKEPRLTFEKTLGKLRLEQVNSDSLHARQQ